MNTENTFKIDFSRLYRETDLNSDRRNTLRNLISLLHKNKKVPTFSTTGLILYLEDEKLRLGDKFSNYYSVDYLIEILKNISQEEFEKRLIENGVPINQDFCLENYNFLSNHGLMKYWNDFSTNFKGILKFVHHFDGVDFFQTFDFKNKRVGFYHNKNLTFYFDSLTEAFVHSKSEKHYSSIMVLLKDSEEK